MQTRSIGAFQKVEKSSALSCSSAHISSIERPGGGTDSQRTPLLQSLLHGGCATMSMSQPSLVVACIATDMAVTAVFGREEIAGPGIMAALEGGVADRAGELAGDENA